LGGTVFGAFVAWARDWATQAQKNAREDARWKVEGQRAQDARLFEHRRAAYGGFLTATQDKLADVFVRAHERQTETVVEEWKHSDQSWKMKQAHTQVVLYGSAEARSAADAVDDALDNFVDLISALPPDAPVPTRPFELKAAMDRFSAAVRSDLGVAEAKLEQQQ
jgi:hypothetical protein